jgi:hypothetical protein
LYFLIISPVKHTSEKTSNVPDRGGDSGNSVFLGNLGLIDWDLGELSGFLVEFDGFGTGGQLCPDTKRRRRLAYTTLSMSTSPPKYRDKSQKWVPCSMTGPISIDLFHHAGLAIAS